MRLVRHGPHRRLLVTALAVFGLVVCGSAVSLVVAKWRKGRAEQTRGQFPLFWESYVTNANEFPSVEGQQETEYEYPDRLYTCPGPLERPIGPVSYYAEASQDHPSPVLGSYGKTGLPDMCVSYEQRYRPYRLLDFDEAGADWGQAQRDCRSASTRAGQAPASRHALVLRHYEGLRLKRDDLENMAALITELNLHSGGWVDVHILFHAKGSEAVFMSEAELQRKLDEWIPRSMHSMTTVWTEPLMRAYFPGLGPDQSALPPTGSYRGCMLPMEYFALKHPNYDYYYNWEMDVRYIGQYYALFKAMAEYGRQVPKDNDNMRWYEVAGLQPHGESSGDSGVGQDADLITFTPVLDAATSEWAWRNDVYNFPEGLDTPHRVALGATSRISKRLMLEMLRRHTSEKQFMFCEMWAPSVAYLAGYKIVFLPHPVYSQRIWPSPELLDEKVNDIHFFREESRMRSMTWYFNARFAKTLYNLWRSQEHKTCRRSVLLHPVKVEDDQA